MTRVLSLMFAMVVASVPMAAAAQYYDDGYGYGPQVVRCSSTSHRTNYCNVDTRGGVRLVRQESRAACVPGRTWGHDRRGIWVSSGCRAQFEIGGGYAGRPGYGRHDYGPGPGYGRPGGGYGQVVRCESNDGRSRFCRIPGGIYRVDLVRQLSRTDCHYNYNWGYRRDGIWVEAGCRGEFRVN